MRVLLPSLASLCIGVLAAHAVLNALLLPTLPRAVSVEEARRHLARIPTVVRLVARIVEAGPALRVLTESPYPGEGERVFNIATDAMTSFVDPYNAPLRLSALRGGDSVNILVDTKTGEFRAGSILALP